MNRPDQKRIRLLYPAVAQKNKQKKNLECGQWPVRLPLRYCDATFYHTVMQSLDFMQCLWEVVCCFQCKPQRTMTAATEERRTWINVSSLFWLAWLQVRCRCSVISAVLSMQSCSGTIIPDPLILFFYFFLPLGTVVFWEYCRHADAKERSWTWIVRAWMRHTARRVSVPSRCLSCSHSEFSWACREHDEATVTPSGGCPAFCVALVAFFRAVH